MRSAAAVSGARDPADFGKKAKRHHVPIEEKESFKWLKSFRAVADVQARCPGTLLVSVGDREADLYELFDEAITHPEGPKLLVRAEHNRQLQDEQQRLWETMQSRPADGIQVLQVPRQGSRAARTAPMSARYAAVSLVAPTGHKGPAIPVWAVLAQEQDAPVGVKPLEWMLLTTVPVTCFEQATEKLMWYARRWGIEVLHRTLKSGCRIEQRQLGQADRIEACLAIDLVVAWRIYYLNKLGREAPQSPCTVYFEEAEWKALMVFTTNDPVAPAQPPTLREAIRRVASLGGFLGRKSDGEPGRQ
ncbi:MAG: IS4 family transposase [Sulfuricella sp.]